ncbi:RrF2 family transcriptional regulator [Iningainema tapete]|uniref:Rrf2 family transcriptional regulator n=1 Tax=Iningainema tapete BLCC-T55 TaxID=2748662 RepID=A0A8J7CGT5_9CYAN|nr:Rrf2 family transcriptional regulator [Iningainema tapete]MBD2776805.1 Rrf2 family transcriptional regulator [Iningainema tapete BLCC-T55]
MSFFLPVELSNKSEYALLALLELAKSYPSGESLQIRQIAELQNIPNRYLDQLLAMLRRGGLIKSIRGAKGGYVLAREPEKITLFDALDCIEGLNAGCGDEKDSNKTIESAVIDEIWQEALGAANSVLQNYTLKDLCERRASRRQMELMYYI